MADLEDLFADLRLGDPRFRIPRLRPILPPPSETPPNLTPFTGDSVLTPGAVPNALMPQSREERQHLSDENVRHLLPGYTAGQLIARYFRPRPDQYGVTESNLSDLGLGASLLGLPLSGIANLSRFSTRTLPSRREILPPPTRELPLPTRELPPPTRELPPPPRPEELGPRIFSPDEINELSRGLRRDPTAEIPPDANLLGPRNLPGNHGRWIDPTLLPPSNTNRLPPRLRTPEEESLLYDQAFMTQEWKNAQARERLRNHSFRIIEGGPSEQIPTNRRNVPKSNEPSAQEIENLNELRRKHDLPPITIEDYRGWNYFNVLRRQDGDHPITLNEFLRLRRFYESEIPPGGGENLRRIGITHDLLQDINPARREARFAGLRDPTGILFPGGQSRFAREGRKVNYDTVYRRYAEGATPKQLASEMGVNVSTIYNALRGGLTEGRYGKYLSDVRGVLDKPTLGRPRRLDYDEIKRLKNEEGLNAIEIGNRVGAHAETIKRLLRRDRNILIGKGSEEQYREARNPAEAILRPGATPFDRNVITTLDKPSHGRPKYNQTEREISIKKWLNRAGIQHSTYESDKRGTNYIKAIHPSTNEQITIRIPRDGHIGVWKSNEAAGNRFDMGTASFTNPPYNEARHITRNISGEEYTNLNTLFDALSHRFSRNPSGQFLVPLGREPVYGARRNPNIIGTMEKPPRFENIHEIQLEFPLSGQHRRDIQLNMPLGGGTSAGVRNLRLMPTREYGPASLEGFGQRRFNLEAPITPDTRRIILEVMNQPAGGGSSGEQIGRMIAIIKRRIRQETGQIITDKDLRKMLQNIARET